MVALPARSEIAPEFTWNAESVFASREAWAAEAEKFAAEVPPMAAKLAGTLGSGPAALLAYLGTAETARLRMGKLFTYAGMTSSSDMNDQQAGAMVGRAFGLYSQLQAATAFAEPEILAIGLDTLRGWIAREPKLEVYAHYFENLYRLQKHVRSAEVEEVLGLMADPLGQVYNTAEMLTNADLKFAPARDNAGTEYTVAQSTVGTLASHADREVRRTAWESYCDTYLGVKNALANNLVTNMKSVATQIRIRRFDSVLHGILHSMNLPVEVVHNLIDVFKRNLPLWHRYWGIRRRALGVETLHHWDIWAPIAKAQPVLSYKEAVEHIARGMTPLGPEYANTLRKGCLEDRWVDVYPSVGKRQGAFSSGAPGTFPFIHTSFDDTIGAMSTLAHELGHSLHSYFTWQNQPTVYADYSMVAAETASNFNQAMVRAYMLNTNTDRDFQIAQIEEAMDNFHRYLLIMPTLTRFELAMYERVEKGAVPTADEMTTLMADLFSETYGGQISVDRDREGITWAQFPHLYQPYYPFTYAVGISGANALASRILEGAPDAAEAYVGFLKSGSSLYTVDALKRAGIDVTTPEPIERGFKVLEGLIDRLDKLV